jgi:Spx/MgsR family transcriptional regulator
MAVTLYGITTCDTVRKARAWLGAHGVDHAYRDLRTDGVDKARLAAWCRKAGWETVLNRASTTFRELPENDKAGLTEAKAIALMLKHPTLIKRPVVESEAGLLVGFKEPAYRAAFGR